MHSCAYAIRKRPMRKVAVAYAVSLLALSGAGLSAIARGAEPPASKAVAAAVADAGRPASDRERDASRKPAAMLAFAGVKPGDGGGASAAGQGSSPRLFAAPVGPTGHVYATVPASL